MATRTKAQDKAAKRQADAAHSDLMSAQAKCVKAYSILHSLTLPKEVGNTRDLTAATESLVNVIERLEMILNH